MGSLVMQTMCQIVIPQWFVLGQFHHLLGTLGACQVLQGTGGLLSLAGHASCTLLPAASTVPSSALALDTASPATRTILQHGQQCHQDFFVRADLMTLRGLTYSSSASQVTKPISMSLALSATPPSEPSTGAVSEAEQEVLVPMGGWNCSLTLLAPALMLSALTLFLLYIVLPLVNKLCVFIKG